MRPPKYDVILPETGSGHINPPLLTAGVSGFSVGSAACGLSVCPFGALVALFAAALAASAFFLASSSFLFLSSSAAILLCSSSRASSIIFSCLTSSLSYSLN